MFLKITRINELERTARNWFPAPEDVGTVVLVTGCETFYRDAMGQLEPMMRRLQDGSLVLAKGEAQRAMAYQFEDREAEVLVTIWIAVTEDGRTVMLCPDEVEFVN